MSGPLKSYRIVDLSNVLMGPYATQLLGDMGAEVIKVEPLEGDMTRGVAPYRNPTMGHIFLNANRSKKSIALDLKTDEGKQVLLRLIEDADALLYNMRPQAMKTLGLTYEALSAINPKLIYCGVFGFSERGPYAGRPAYDDLIQGLVTLPSLSVDAGSAEPRYVPFAIADRTTGLMAALAILGALLHVKETGRGQRIDVPMLESMASFVLNDHLAGATFVPPIGKAGYSRQLSKDRRPYKTQDGYVCVMIYNDKQWKNFQSALGGVAKFAFDPRYSTYADRIQHSDELLAKLADLFASRKTDEWLEILNGADIPATPLHSLETVFDDPHLKAIGFFEIEEHPSEGALLRMPPPGYWSETQPRSERPAPLLGEHTIELLAAAGYSPERIEDLVKRGIVRTSRAVPSTCAEVE